MARAIAVVVELYNIIVDVVDNITLAAHVCPGLIRYLYTNKSPLSVTIISHENKLWYTKIFLQIYVQSTIFCV